MAKFTLALILAAVALAAANPDVTYHYGKGGHGVSSRYFRKAQPFGYGLYGLGYGLGYYGGLGHYGGLGYYGGFGGNYGAVGSGYGSRYDSREDAFGYGLGYGLGHYGLGYY